MNRNSRQNLRLGTLAKSLYARRRDLAILRARGSLDAFQFAADAGCTPNSAGRRLRLLAKAGWAVFVKGTMPHRYVSTLL